MKTTVKLYLFLLIMLAISCSKEIAEPDIKHDSEDSIATRSDIVNNDKCYDISLEMALTFARSFNNRPKIVSVEPYLFEGIVCLYIINYEQGWMVIPADSRVQAVLGESESGDFYVNETDNKEVLFWLEVSAERVLKAKKGEVIDFSENGVLLWDQIRNQTQGNEARSLDPDPLAWVRVTTVTTNTDVYANVPHLLQTKWGQWNPWNVSLPYDPMILEDSGLQVRFLTGCVPTAVAQVLYYFHNFTGYPNDFYQEMTPYIDSNLGNNQYKVGLIRDDNFYTTNSNRWNNMPLTEDDSGSFSYVSDLMMDVGVRMNVTYSTSGTAGTMLSYTDVAPCGITANSYYYSYSTVRNNLNLGKPVLVSGIGSDGVGHAWVIDGCIDNVYRTSVSSEYFVFRPGYIYPPNAEYLSESQVLSEYPNAYDGMIITTNTSVPTKYLLMNFGRDGNHDDGHYAIEPSGSEWQGYTNAVGTIYNISTGQLLIN